MKRERWVSTCPVCGDNANTSRLLVKAKSGKVYYYLKFYHNPKNVHLLPTDSSYSNSPTIQKKARNLHTALVEYIETRKNSRKYAYMPLKREVERFYNGTVYNEEFYRAINKAISAGLLERVEDGRKSFYLKTQEIEREEKVKYNQLAINYDFSSKIVKVSAFLEVTNYGLTPLRNISYFVPFGELNSLGQLNLQVQDESGEIPEYNLKITSSASLKTAFSITLNRTLEKMEKDIVFLKYNMPYADQSINFLVPAVIDFLRIGAVVENGYHANIIRILLNGIKEIELPFQRNRFCNYDHTCFHTELEHIQKGESILIKLTKKDKEVPTPLY